MAESWPETLRGPGLLGVPRPVVRRAPRPVVGQGRSVDTSAITNRPVVVTLAVDDETQRRWDALRRRHFPPHRLLVGAHVTLFHTVPGEHAEAALADAQVVAARTERFPFTEDEPYSLGCGVALRVVSPGLRAVHADLATRWGRWLSRQDSQPFRPHVTLQNKVGPQLARETLAELRATARSGWTGTATGIALWHYEGGPWTPIRTVPFGAP